LKPNESPFAACYNAEMKFVASWHQHPECFQSVFGKKKGRHAQQVLAVATLAAEESNKERENKSKRLVADAAKSAGDEGVTRRLPTA
jgi:hypothetical protein